MVRAFHDAGIKVLLDVILNHTGEGLLARDSEGDDSRTDDARQFPERARLLSLRGLDNATYYTLRSSDLDGRPNLRYQDNSACGPSLAVARSQVREFLVEVLSYWVDEMGVDGFRFDLAPVLGNSRPSDGFTFDAADPDGLLQQLGRRLPLRTAREPDGVDLVAEPWAIGPGTYQLGRFPAGWAHWNDVFRTVARRAENRFRVDSVRPWELANVVSGSRQQLDPPDAAADDGGPSWSVNYISAHDGLTLRDVYSVTGDDRRGTTAATSSPSGRPCATPWSCSPPRRASPCSRAVTSCSARWAATGIPSRSTTTAPGCTGMAWRNSSVPSATATRRRPPPSRARRRPDVPVHPGDVRLPHRAPRPAPRPLLHRCGPAGRHAARPGLVRARRP